MLEISHKNIGLITGQSLMECRHRSAAFQNLFPQLALIFSAPDSTEIRSLVPSDPIDRMALGAPLLMELCCAPLGSRLTSAVSRDRQSDHQNQDEAVEYLYRYSQWPFSICADGPMSISL